MSELKIKQLFDNDTCTYTYLLWNIDTNNAIIIDPVLEKLDRDINLINKLKLDLLYIFETHVHADHITSATELKKITSAKICYGAKTGVVGADILFSDGEKFYLDEYKIIAIHTPGHTSGCISYYTKGSIFTGDTLFIEGTGRTDFQGGSANDIYDSIRNKIFCYSDNTVVYPCHNYNGLLSSTIGFERAFNPNVGDNILKQDFINNEEKKKRPYPKRFDISVPANLNCGKL